MWADVEPIACAIRVFHDGAVYGDPYTWAATIRYIDRKTIEIIGITCAPKPSEWRAIVARMKCDGVSKIVFSRKRGGNDESHTIDV